LSVFSNKRAPGNSGLLEDQAFTGWSKVGSIPKKKAEEDLYGRCGHRLLNSLGRGWSQKLPKGGGGREFAGDLKVQPVLCRGHAH